MAAREVIGRAALLLEEAAKREHRDPGVANRQTASVGPVISRLYILIPPANELKKRASPPESFRRRDLVHDAFGCLADIARKVFRPRGHYRRDAGSKPQSRGHGATDWLFPQYISDAQRSLRQSFIPRVIGS